MSNAVSNDNLKNYRDDIGTTGFSPAVSYEYDATAKEVELVDETTYPDGVFLKKVHVRVHDKFGNQANGTIVEIPGSGNEDSITVDVSSLDPSKGLDITATVLADDNKLIADGGAYNILAAGSLGSWDAQKNA